MVIITLFSLFSFPDDVTGGIDIAHMDKMVHFTFHCVLVVLGILAYKERKGQTFKIGWAITQFFVFSLVYGIIIEVLQYYMPFDRSAEFWDVLANLSGALVGILLIKKYLSLTDALK